MLFAPSFPRAVAKRGANGRYRKRIVDLLFSAIADGLPWHERAFIIKLDSVQSGQPEDATITAEAHVIWPVPAQDNIDCEH